MDAAVKMDRSAEAFHFSDSLPLSQVVIDRDCVDSSAIAIDGNPTVDRMASKKALVPDQNDQVRAMLSRLVQSKFGGNQSAAARALGVSSSFVNEVLSGRRGAGNTLINALADYTGKSTDELRGRAHDDVDVAKHGAAALGSHRLWDEIREQLKPMYSPAILDELERATFAEGVRELVSVAFVKRLCDALVEATFEASARAAAKHGSGEHPAVVPPTKSRAR